MSRCNRNWGGEMFNRYRWMRRSKRRVARFMTSPTKVVLLLATAAVTTALLLQ
jgi:low affinity Fe/Cu permease